MKIQWGAEACDHHTDPESGSMLVKLTASSATNTNIYCEQPYSSPDGNRVAIMRKFDYSFDVGARLIVADLKTLKLALIESDGVTGVFNAAWSGQLFYGKTDDSLWCVDLQSLEKRPIKLPETCTLRGRGATVSPDQRYIAFGNMNPPDHCEVVVLDLQTGEEKVILDEPDLTNPHLQFNPVTGKDLLVQHNQGSVVNARGEWVKSCDERGTTHFIVGRDGSNKRPLPAGPPYTVTSTGHSNWIADTGMVAWCAHWDLKTWGLGELNSGNGNMHYAAAHDKKATAFVCPEHRFNHINVSKCGRYFVCDSVQHGLYDDRGVIRHPSLVIGNFKTGKYRTLVTNTGCTNGGAQHTHPHAYLTADNRNVIFNADPNMTVPQVWAARVPDAFLASLD